MKRTGIAAFLVILALATGLTLFNRCSGGDMARVTIVINTDNALITHKSNLIDRLRSIFETNLYATMIGDWVSGYDTLTLTVSGSDFETITTVIPPTAESYTVEVPAGSGRIFTVIATQSGVRKNGGRSIETLAPGENKTIQLRMLPIPTGLTIEGTVSTVNVIWSYIPGATGYYIYRAVNSASGPYTRIGGLVPQGTAGNYGIISLQSVESGNTYFFRVTMASAYGEGVESVEQSVTIP